jgi:hypothetical protein
MKLMKRLHAEVMSTRGLACDTMTVNVLDQILSMANKDHDADRYSGKQIHISNVYYSLQISPPVLLETLESSKESPCPLTLHRNPAEAKGKRCHQDAAEEVITKKPKFDHHDDHEQQILYDTVIAERLNSNDAEVNETENVIVLEDCAQPGIVVLFSAISRHHWTNPHTLQSIPFFGSGYEH